jgi:hypothetical protein
MVYGLNDADERVRKESADEIGDALKKNHCCCNQEIVSALTCALADCDRGVRRKAERALRICGYDVVDGCCKTSCCASVGGCATAPAGPTPMAPMAPVPPSAAPAPAPAPAPPEDPKAYFPSRLRDQQTQDGVRQTNRLANLFGSVD